MSRRTGPAAQATAIVALLALGWLAGCSSADVNRLPALVQPPCQAEPIATQANPTVVMRTNFGDLEAEIFRNQVPITADNFLGLAASGYYDGTFFHRAKADFVLQGGDPNTRDNNTANDGLGGPGHRIPDELHHALRHDGPGVLSMAHSGPNTAGSQFFVTFNATPQLDDANSVFGRVTRGLAVLERIEAEAASPEGDPRVPIELLGIDVREGQQDEDAHPGNFSLWAPNPHHRVPERGGRSGFALVVENHGDRIAPVCIVLTSAGEARGVSAATEEGFASFLLPAGQRLAFVASVQADERSPPLATVHVTARAPQESGSAESPQLGDAGTLDLSVERSPSVTPPGAKGTDSVQFHWIGMVADGRVFDTSVGVVARQADDEMRGFRGFSLRTDYQTVRSVVDEHPVPGVRDLLRGLEEGATGAARIPPKEAFGESCAISGAVVTCSPLAGRTVLYEITIVDIEGA